MSKIAIYQLLPRYFGNTGKNILNGSIVENGCGKFNDITKEALSSIAEMGCTHIWLTGVLEHATQTDYQFIGIKADHPAIVKGKAGSPYAIKDYYDVDPDLACNPEQRMDEFLDLLDRIHAEGLKVLIDFVPNHVARRYHSDAKPEGVRDFGVDDQKKHGFDPSNNYYYLQDALNLSFANENHSENPYIENPAKVTGNDCFTSSPTKNDWYDTVKLNYGVDYPSGGAHHFDPIPATWFKMLDILTYWSNLGVDGFRCDMAEMVPVCFWHWVIPRVKKINTSIIFIAEIYQVHLYGEYLKHGGFDYLYDKEGMYNTVRGIIEGRRPASDLTQCWQQINNLQPHMLTFLENHDEQRLASDFFASDPQKGLPGMFVLTFYHQNPVMIYAGQELGERGMYEEGFSGRDGRNTIFDYWSIETLVRWKNEGRWNLKLLTEDERSLRETYQKYLKLCLSELAVVKGDFFDLQYANIDSPDYHAWNLYAFIRKYENELLIGVANFSQAEQSVSLSIPKHAFNCLSIPEMQNAEFKDLLTDTVFESSLNPFENLRFSIPGYQSRLYKVILK